MFKVKHKKDSKIVQVLDTAIDEVCGNTFFLIWENNGWNTKEKFLQRQQDDLKKFEYCKNNNIKLYYITYLDNIEEKVKEILNEVYS
jgi:hypothetical protein